MTSHLPSQSSLLGVPRELRDLVLRYALPDVTFCVTECKWASRHDHSSNNNQEESEYQDAFKDMILDEPQDPRNYRAQRYIHLSVNSGGTPTPSPEGSNLHTAFALLSTNHQLRLESQSIFLQAPTSFLFDSTRGSPTFALANETLGILDSAELLKISHISVYGLHPSVSEDMPIGLPLPTRTRLLADYSCEQQALFVKLVGAMRLKTLFLEIYHDELSGLFSVIQVCRSWLETCWQLQGLSELKVQYTIPKDGVTDQYVRDLQDFVVELNQIPHVSAIIERRA
ncbi:MAG: hypothetical protein LQ347_005417 [Umbilicaria vellea]|nr:MAG: hypothetical protein LQ347_005417 [Umbilicaria vellea]